MTVVVMAVFLALLAGVQSMLPTVVWLGQAKAPLLLGGVLYYALTRERGLMLLGAFLAGLFHDALGPLPLGMSCFCFCLAGLAVSRFRDLVFHEAVVTSVLFGCLMSAGVTVLFHVLLWRGGHLHYPFWWLASKVLGVVLMATVLMPVVFAAAGLLDRFVGTVSASRRRRDGVERFF